MACCDRLRSLAKIYVFCAKPASSPAVAIHTAFICMHVAANFARVVLKGQLFWGPASPAALNKKDEKGQGGKEGRGFFQNVG